MKRFILLGSIALISIASISSNRAEAKVVPVPADSVFINGNIYTVNEKQPHAEALAVKDSRIVYVGSNQGATAYRGPKTNMIDLHGATVVPGLTDSHYHLMGVGEREVTLNLEGTTSLEDFLSKVKARVDKTESGKWVTGRGWIETFWSPQAFPTKYDLDKVSPNNPIFLERADGHGAVANSLAFKIAGITKDTPNPFGGEILKDKQSGEILHKQHVMGAITGVSGNCKAASKASCPEVPPGFGVRQSSAAFPATIQQFCTFPGP